MYFIENFRWKSTINFQWNAFENIVCERMVILSRGQYVNAYSGIDDAYKIDGGISTTDTQILLM